MVETGENEELLITKPEEEAQISPVKKSGRRLKRK
jgi:hypothetical protein